MILFIDLTVASTFPLLYGYVGEEVISWNPHSLEKSQNGLDVNGWLALAARISALDGCHQFIWPGFRERASGTLFRTPFTH